MFKSIRWKFITIYFLLVFIAMIIIGIFLLQQFQQYHLGIVRDNIAQTANNVITTLEDLDWNNNKNDIQQNILEYKMDMRLEIFVIDKDQNFTIIATTNPIYLNQNATKNILETDLIMGAFTDEELEKDIPGHSKNMVYPLYDEHSRVIGALYLRRDLDDINKTLDQSIIIIVKATFLALVITIVLGFFIAKSITGPINDVTIKASKMAKGDFNQVVEVKSDDEIGQLAKMFNYLTDRLKSVLQEMSNEKQKMDTIITYMADGLIATTEDGKIIHANPKALEMMELKESSISNSSFDAIFSQFPDVLSYEDIKGDEENWSGDEMIDINGAILRVSYAPYRNPKGDFGGIIVLLQDVTKHEKLENMRKEFVANVSHELKTPLTTIKSYTETLLDGALENTELATHFLNVVDTEADRMARLVRDLLQLSNLDYQQGMWNKKAIDISTIIKKAVLRLEVSAKNKEHHLIFNCPKDSHIVSIDEDKMEQVVLNIISNSIKYTSDGGKIIVEVEASDNRAIVTIKDNGMGIPKEDLPRIFERFYRVDKARSREMGGTGLGLSIAKEIVEAHEGEISIESGEEKGTKVTISLPLIQENVV